MLHPMVSTIDDLAQSSHHILHARAKCFLARIGAYPIEHDIMQFDPAAHRELIVFAMRVSCC